MKKITMLCAGLIAVFMFSYAQAADTNKDLKSAEQTGVSKADEPVIPSRVDMMMEANKSSDGLQKCKDRCDRRYSSCNDKVRDTLLKAEDTCRDDYKSDNDKCFDTYTDVTNECRYTQNKCNDECEGDECSKCDDEWDSCHSDANSDVQSCYDDAKDTKTSCIRDAQDDKDDGYSDCQRDKDDCEGDCEADFK
jgi:hypothetical protein